MNTNRTIHPLLPIYLDEMIGAIEKILLYAKDLDFEAFYNNSMVCDAIQHQFEILGEASTHVPYAVRKKFVQIPFSLMYSLRNHIAHEYFDIDFEIIWGIIHTDLNKNLADLKRMKGSAVVAAAAGQ
jgi:uncharacterized protein with HEPN domain